MIDDNSSRGSNGGNQDDHLNASYKTLSSIKQALLTADIYNIAEKLRLLIRQTNGKTNTSPLDMYLLPILTIPDISLQMHILSAISFLVPSDSAALQFLPGYLKLTLKTPELVSRTLRCILSVLTLDLFDSLKDEIIRFVEQGTDYDRRLSLYIIHKAYTLNNNNIDLLLAQIRRALFDPAMVNGAIIVITEIAEQQKSKVKHLLPYLIKFINPENDFTYTKLCIIFSFFVCDDENFARTLFSKLYFYLNGHNTLSFLIPTGRLLANLSFDHEIIQLVCQQLDNAIMVIRNSESLLEIANILGMFNGRYRASPRSVRVLLDCQCHQVVARAIWLCLREPHLAEVATDDERAEIANELVVMGSTPTQAAIVFDLIPRKGSFFITIVFEIYNRLPLLSNKLLAEAIHGAEDFETKKALIKEAKTKLKNLPDNEVGIAIAELISQVSDDPTDFEVLLPSNASYMSPEFQNAMLGCVFDFCQRLQFPVTAEHLDRLTQLKVSGNREVGQRALEIIEYLSIKK